MHHQKNGRRGLYSVVAGTFFCTVFSAMGEVAADNLVGFAADCKAAEKRFLESDYPNSEDAERFFDCFRVDFTYGSITQVITLELPENDEHCHREAKGLSSDCADPSRG
ncbi:MAG: hypothetical protein OXR62_03405 [Ahrensia sp.]|nr:hypothetical protein [Ahrensia sp.]